MEKKKKKGNHCLAVTQFPFSIRKNILIKKVYSCIYKKKIKLLRKLYKDIREILWNNFNLAQ